MIQVDITLPRDGIAQDPALADKLVAVVLEHYEEGSSKHCLWRGYCGNVSTMIHVRLGIQVTVHA